MPVFKPVKMPSTVFNNNLHIIMQRLAAQNGLQFNVNKSLFRSVEYQIIDVEYGVSAGTNPFDSTELKANVVINSETLNNSRSIHSDDKIAGVVPKQFFNNEVEVVEYFAQIEANMQQQIDKYTKLDTDSAKE